MNQDAKTEDDSSRYLSRIQAVTGNAEANPITPGPSRRRRRVSPAEVDHLHIRFAGRDWLTVLQRLDAASAVRGIPTATFVRALLARWAETVTDEQIVKPPKHLTKDERMALASLMLPALAAARSRVGIRKAGLYPQEESL